MPSIVINLLFLISHMIIFFRIVNYIHNSRYSNRRKNPQNKNQKYTLLPIIIRYLITTNTK